MFAGLLFAAASSLSTDSIAQANPNYHRSRTRPVIPFRHLTLAAPPGMVYIPGGSVTIKYSQSSTDTNSKKRVSLSSFYIDKTEVTNQQYRMFTEWVIDSIAIVNYLKDDWYFLDPPPAQKAVIPPPVAAVADTTGGVKDTIPSALGSDIPGGAPAPAAPAPKTDTVMVPATAGATTDTAQKFTTSSAITDSNGNIVRRRINWARVKHKDIFDNNDEEIRAKIAPMIDQTTGKIKKELYVYPFTYLKATGTNRNVKIGEYATEHINIFPDEAIWFKDLNNSQVDILVENYFTQEPFDDYPVVGVSWKQARAFAAWRSHTNNEYADIAEYLKYYRLQYSLPSEAQWVYAAGKDIKNSNEPVAEPEPEPGPTPADTAATTAAAPVLDSAGNPIAAEPAASTDTVTVASADGIPTSTEDGETKKEKKKKKKKKKSEEEEEETPDEIVMAKSEKDGPALVDRDRDGNLLVNFKQDEGDYSVDGSNFTLPVMSYAPNEFGVYNMVGNVSEWVLDAYSPSSFAFVSDINPVLLYDADPKDADAMKRKVIRGGSFISNAKALSPFTRDFELQDNVHCYIGFRCVMSAPEILTKKVATRRKLTGSKPPTASTVSAAGKGGNAPATSSKTSSKK
jgi:formylglycine-generating enzyme required for sulfatase activity